MDSIGSYGYAVGRVKALESRLIEPSVFQRMIDAADFEEALRFLSDGDYSGKLPRIGFEESLDSFVAEAYKVVSGYSPDPYFTGMFLAEYDFLKLKAFLKEAFLKAQGLAVPIAKAPALGFADVQAVRSIAYEAQAADVKPGSRLSFGDNKKPTDEQALMVALKDSAEKACYRYRQAGTDPLEIDAAVDVSYFSYLSSVAKSRSAAWAIEIVAAKADTANLMLLMRSKRAGKSERFIADSVVPGGAIMPHRLIQAASSGEEGLRRVLDSSPYWRSLSEAFDRWQKDGSIRSFEMAASMLVYSMVMKARTATEGYVPVMGYLLMRQQEASIIRRILAGKAKGLPAVFIRERLCEGNA